MNIAAEDAMRPSAPSLLTQGFRPFFLAAGLWSAVALALWIVIFATGTAIPSRFDPLAWHIHEMLFGVVMAAIAGFLLTAIPNWTGRLPINGGPLALLAGLWLVGRIACLVSILINIAPPAAEARWFKLVGVRLGNTSERYPYGDEVQTVEPWDPPDMWAQISTVVANEILNQIEAGLADGRRYSGAPQAGQERAAWRVVQQFAAGLCDRQSRKVIATWLENKVLSTEPYQDPVARKESSGLVVNAAKRPG
jgi:hypothetical protein